ncbi:MAG: hypothetical protein ACOCXP_03425 [Candidatus Dojkabacteria bacterium]
MHFFIYYAQKPFSFLLGLILLFGLLGVDSAVIHGPALGVSSAVLARDLGEIQRELKQKEEEKAAIDAELGELEQNLAEKRAAEGSASNELEKIQAEIDLIEAEIAYNEKQMEQLERDKELKLLEQEERERKQDEQVELSYKSWKAGSHIDTFFSGGNFVRQQIYNESVTTKAHGGILGLATEIVGLQEDYEEFLSSSESLQGSIEELAEKRTEAQARLDAVRQERLAVSREVSGVRGESSNLQTAIDELSAEQKALQQKENDLTRGTPTGGTREIADGEYYFSGTGRDLYQGHGVGMSQYGALGAALQGWDYKRILEFYFPGTRVDSSVSMPASINVNGYGSMPLETYVAGAGEVPDVACEDIGVEFSPNNFWGCWPREAILAQTVAFRTFGARRAGGIATDTTAQVYKGGNGKQWAAQATTGVSVNYNGGVANVFYSSDNNQGFGTANNDTVWSSFSGNGSPLPYLRSVNDNSFAYKSQWTNWSWRTNSYSNEDLNSFLAWGASSSSVSSSTRSFVSEIRNDIGSLRSISFQLDPSRRVNKLVLNGDRGSREIAGWLWKSLWNVWVGTVKPSGETDYIYSLTFSMQQG